VALLSVLIWLLHLFNWICLVFRLQPNALDSARITNISIIDHDGEPVGFHAGFRLAAEAETEAG